MSDLIVGLFVAILGLVGLVLIAGAVDDEILIFGWGLVAFAVLFNLGLVKGHYDRADAARERAR